MGFGLKIASVLAPAVSSLIGGERQNNSAVSNAREANEFTREQMRNRHQWEVEDLKKAGLNPVLSAHGAPSMGGSAMASVPANSFGDAVGSAMEAKRLDAEINNMLEVNKNLRAEHDKIRSDTDLNRDLSQSARAEAVLKTANARVASNTAAITAADLPLAAIKADAFQKAHSSAKAFRSMMKAFTSFRPATPARHFK